MGFSVSTLDDRSDAELISAVRAGDVSAYGELFARHVAAARRLARQLVPGPDVDDLVSESFAKVLGVLQRGGGPDLAFRAYLLTAVRRVHVDRIRASARLHTTDDLSPFDPGIPFRDTAVEGFESEAAARAFASLPERWQLVLWHTEVEEQKPAEVAPLLGMTPNAVSALAYRAREGLRQAYLTMHAADVGDDACERTRAELGAYVRGGLARRDVTRVEQHLERCRPCAALYLELAEVNANLRAVLAPLLLGGAAAAYVASGSGSAVTGLALLLGRARDLVLAHGPTAAVAGAAASAVVAGTAITLHQTPGEGPAAVEAPVATGPPSVLEAAPDPLRRASHTVDRSGGVPVRPPTPRSPARATDMPARSVPGPSTSAPPAPADPPPAPGTTPGGVPETAPPTTPRSTPPSTAQPSPQSAPQEAPQEAPQKAPQKPAPPASPAPAAPSPTGAPAEPLPAEPAPSPRPPLVAGSATVSVGTGSVELGLGLDLAGRPIVPQTTLGVPLPGSG